MPRDFYDEMMIGLARAKRGRAAWIDGCALALGRLGLPGTPEQLGAIAVRLHEEMGRRAPDEAARAYAERPR